MQERKKWTLCSHFCRQSFVRHLPLATRLLSGEAMSASFEAVHFLESEAEEKTSPAPESSPNRGWLKKASGLTSHSTRLA